MRGLALTAEQERLAYQGNMRTLLSDVNIHVTTGRHGVGTYTQLCRAAPPHALSSASRSKLRKNRQPSGAPVWGRKNGRLASEYMSPDGSPRIGTNSPAQSDPSLTPWDEAYELDMREQRRQLHAAGWHTPDATLASFCKRAAQTSELQTGRSYSDVTPGQISFVTSVSEMSANGSHDRPSAGD
jgi:hypothetical protein